MTSSKTRKPAAQQTLKACSTSLQFTAARQACHLRALQAHRPSSVYACMQGSSGSLPMFRQPTLSVRITQAFLLYISQPGVSSMPVPYMRLCARPIREARRTPPNQAQTQTPQKPQQPKCASYARRSSSRGICCLIWSRQRSCQSRQGRWSYTARQCMQRAPPHTVRHRAGHASHNDPRTQLPCLTAQHTYTVSPASFRRTHSDHGPPTPTRHALLYHYIQRLGIQKRVCYPTAAS